VAFARVQLTVNKTTNKHAYHQAPVASSINTATHLDETVSTIRIASSSHSRLLPRPTEATDICTHLRHSRFFIHPALHIIHKSDHTKIQIDMAPPACLRFEIPNKHGCLPPSGCAYPRNKKEPKIAIGDKSLGPFAAALLVKDEQLVEILSEITSRSATLKAWFAHRLKTKGTKTKSPVWGLIWNTLQSKGAAWTAQYKRGGFQGIQWEFQAPASKIDLWAYTLCVLYCNVNDNLDCNEGTADTFHWHKYYYEAEGKYFLLYSLMKCCNLVLNPGHQNTIFRPTNPRGEAYWRETCGGQIGMAAEDFMDGE
jgi:hypothetical protein